jgi:methyl-accepting chemotaxis protein
MSDSKQDEPLKKGGDEPASKNQLDTKTDAILKAIKAGPETNKNIFESLFEAFGLKDLLSAIKDGENLASKLMLAFGVLAALILGKLLDFGKLFNAGLERVTRAIANRNTPTGEARRPGRVIAINESGRPQRMTRAQMDALNSVSINPHGLTPTLLNDLKTALSGLPEKIRDFNSATRDMKSPSTITKIAKTIGTLKAKLTPNPAEDIKEVATAIGELNGKLQHYNPEKLPKPQTFKKIADAAKDLNRNADTLRRTFVDLATASSTAAGAIGGGATAPAAG